MSPLGCAISVFTATITQMRPHPPTVLQMDPVRSLNELTCL